MTSVGAVLDRVIRSEDPAVAAGERAALQQTARRPVGEVTVLDRPVLVSGRRELLPVLREPSVSRTRHRFAHVPD